ncbi:MAG: hypothetical protein GXC73_16625, partial [Chitinophagaceae bacterium]|nr:hypothetical protein [Chitinophagaceae bacterium]
RVVEKLLIHSYFEYDFLDPAMAKALGALEMAFKIRHRELTGKQGRIYLSELNDYLHNNGYFEGERKGLLDALRNQRNNFAHPEKSFGGGLGLMKVFSHCVNLVNEIYEDRNMRLMRANEKKAINENLQKLTKSGAIVKDGNNSYIIYEASIEFINNAQTEKKYWGYFKLIFSLNGEQDEEKKDVNSLFYFEAESCEIDNKGSVVKFVITDNTIIQFLPITKKDHELRFDKWKNEFYASREGLDYNSQMNFEIDRKLAKIMSDFHHRK